MKSLVKLTFLLLTLASCCLGQAVLLPMPRQCFLDTLNKGQPLAGGKIYTCVAGTSCPGNPLASFTDATGATQNQNPITLDAAGCAGIWLTAGIPYKIVGQNSTFVQEWSVDSVSGLLTFQGTAQAIATVAFSATPTFTSSAQTQLFKMTLTGNVTSSTLVMTGISAPSIVTFELTQDSTGSRTFVWPLNTVGGATIASAANAVTVQQFVWDGLLAEAIGPAQTGAGPAIVAGAITGTTGTFANVVTPSLTLNGAQAVTGLQGTAGTKLATGTGSWTNGHLLQANGTSDIADAGAAGAVTLVSIANASSTGTTLNTLTKLTGAPATAVIAGTLDTSGVVGITVAGAGTTGSATIQEGGLVSCVFDTATVAGHYAQISSVTAGNCRDNGNTGYQGAQNIGRVLTTNGGAGTYQILLFPPDIPSSPSMYSAGGVLNGSAIKFVATTGSLVAGSSTTNFSGSAIFNTTPSCWAQDTGAANATKVVVNSTSQVVVTGTGTDTYLLVCMGY